MSYVVTNVSILYSTFSKLSGERCLRSGVWFSFPLKPFRRCCWLPCNPRNTTEVLGIPTGGVTVFRLVNLS